MNQNEKICYVVNNAAFFVSHRLPIALRAIESGFQVYLVIGMAGSPAIEAKALELIKQYSIELIQIKFEASGTNLIKELLTIFNIYQCLKRIKPNVIHCVSPKGVAYGGIASRFLIPNRLILAISGMGYIYVEDSGTSIYKKLLATIYQILLRFIVKHPNKKIIVQNGDDYLRFLNFRHVNKDDIKLIKGSGVDLSLYQNIDFEKKEKIVLFPARILRDKGAVEFYEATVLLKKKFCDWRFIMAGVFDYSNPSMIDEAVLNLWKESGNVELVGHVNEIHHLYAKTSIVCLPSYGEGLPKALLEASAAGCAVITTNVIGCRDAVIDGITGDLVKPKSSEAVIAAIEKLIENPKIRKSYGLAGMLRAKNNYGINKVIDSTIALYKY